LELLERHRGDVGLTTIRQRAEPASTFAGPPPIATPPTHGRVLMHPRVPLIRDDFDAMDTDTHDNAEHWSDARLVAYAVLSGVEAIICELREMRAASTAVES
jgi:hypothetical protein